MGFSATTMLVCIFARLNHAGNLSNFFAVQRGARQGDPIASLLFIIVIELLAIKIRNSSLIQGVEIGGKEIKASLYADDSNLFLKYCEQNLRNTIEILNQFYLFSGLKIQTEKSQCVIFGKIPEGNLSICPEIKLIWNQEFCSLGINFTADLENMETNFDLKVDIIKSTITNWKHRYLSPLGKLCVVKTLLMSKVAHLALVLPNLSKTKIKIIEDILYNFIWDGPDKVARWDAKMPERIGGLNSPDLLASWESFKISWWRRVIKNTHSSWGHILQHSLTEINPILSIDNLVTQTSFKEWNQLGHTITNPFWKQCLLALKPLTTEIIKRNPTEILKYPIWESVLFLRNNVPCKKNKFSTLSNKLFYPIDFMTHDENGLRFLSDLEIEAKVGNAVNILESTQIRHIIKQTCQKYELNISQITVSLPFKPATLNFLTA